MRRVDPIVWLWLYDSETAHNVSHHGITKLYQGKFSIYETNRIKVGDVISDQIIQNEFF